MSTIGPWVRASQVDWVAERLGRTCQPGDLGDDLLDAEQGRSLADADVKSRLRVVAAVMAPVADWCDDNGHDVLVSPVAFEPAWPLGEDAQSRTGMFVAPFSFSGPPAVIIADRAPADKSRTNGSRADLVHS